ncbi:MAG: 3-isopropylmalate dehydrogenase [Gemmatimonadaceae bacterium]
MRAVIAYLPGDGVGPEVGAEAVRVLAAVGDRFRHQFEVREALIGGVAIDTFGDPLPRETRAVVEAADAVLLGAVGGPRWSDPASPVRPEQGLLALRRLLGTYANLRPVRIHAAGRDISPVRPERLDGVDLVVVRELTGGLYYGEKHRQPNANGGETAWETCTYSTAEVERVVRVAGQLARARRQRVASIDKANVLETSRLWREVTTRVMREEFPDVALEHMLVDACAMHLVREPARFDVIVTENLFGDILTDEASVLAGSIGLLPSASLGADVRRGAARRAGLYEPIHGSAPDIAGQGCANPVGMILSVAMLLRWSFALEEEAACIERAVTQALDDGLRTADLVSNGMPACGTRDLGGAVASRVGVADGR